MRSHKSFRTTSVTVRENLVDGMLECVGEHNNRLRYLLLSSSRVASLKEDYIKTLAIVVFKKILKELFKL